MEKILEIVVHSLGAFNGIFLLNEKEVPEDLADIYNEVFFEEKARPLSADKANMGGDLRLFKNDFKQSIKKANLSLSNG